MTQLFDIAGAGDFVFHNVANLFILSWFDWRLLQKAQETPLHCQMINYNVCLDTSKYQQILTILLFCLMFFLNPKKCTKIIEYEKFKKEGEKKGLIKKEEELLNELYESYTEQKENLEKIRKKEMK